jgi:hypothetical protein
MFIEALLPLIGAYSFIATVFKLLDIIRETSALSAHNMWVT